MSRPSTISYSREQGVAILEFDADHEMNPFSQPRMRELLDLIEAVEDDETLGAIVLYGGDGRSFAAGGDFKEMIREICYCSCIANYSRHLSGRAPGEPPPTLFEYLPKNALVIVDESHATIPQIGAMFKGDRSRKETLVEFGFRLPSALVNRPLRFEEFQERQPQTIYVSAPPRDYEIQHAGAIGEQVVRPTGLLDLSFARKCGEVLRSRLADVGLLSGLFLLLAQLLRIRLRSGRIAFLHLDGFRRCFRGGLLAVVYDALGIGPFVDFFARVDGHRYRGSAKR